MGKVITNISFLNDLELKVHEDTQDYILWKELKIINSLKTYIDILKTSYFFKIRRTIKTQ